MHRARTAMPSHPPHAHGSLSRSHSLNDDRLVLNALKGVGVGDRDRSCRDHGERVSEPCVVGGMASRERDGRDDTCIT